MKKQKKSIAVLLSILFLIIVSISISGCGTLAPLSNTGMKRSQINSLVSKNKSLAFYTKTVYKDLKISVLKDSNYELVDFDFFRDSGLFGNPRSTADNIKRLYNDYCSALGDKFTIDPNVGFYFNFYKNFLHNWVNNNPHKLYTWGQFACEDSSGSMVFALNIIYDYSHSTTLIGGDRIRSKIGWFAIGLAKPTYEYAKKIKLNEIKFKKNYFKFYDGNSDNNNVKFSLNLIPSKNSIKVKKIKTGFFSYPFFHFGAFDIGGYIGNFESHKYHHYFESHKYPHYDIFKLNIHNDSRKPYILNLMENKTIKNPKTGNIYEILPVHNKKIVKSGNECTYLNDNKKLLINPSGNCSISFNTKIPGFLFSFNKSPILYFGKLPFDLKAVSEYDLKNKGNN